MFTKDLACKWGMHNIQVNAIAPGWFPTDMSRKVIERDQAGLLATIPLGRFGGPQDLKGAAIFSRFRHFRFCYWTHSRC